MAVRHDVGDEAGRARRIHAFQNPAIGDAGLPSQLRLDGGEAEAQATRLHATTAIGPALEAAIGALPCPRARRHLR